MRVAVTGATGFVGRHVAIALAQRGHEVLAFGHRPEATVPSSLGGCSDHMSESGERAAFAQYRSWDISAGCIDAVHADAVVHCAALVGDWGDERFYHAVNVKGTSAVLQSFPRARLVHVSTSSVYSDSVHRARKPIAETADTGRCGHSAYGRTKAASEKLVLDRAGSVVLRPHIVYGPGDTTLFPRVLAARRFGRLAMPGDGRNQVSVTHVFNLVSAVVAAVEDKDAAGTFNIADEAPSTVRDLVETLLSRTGHPTKLHFVPAGLSWIAATALETAWPGNAPPRGPRITRYVVQQLSQEHVLDISKARHVLQYVPRRDYRTGEL